MQNSSDRVSPFPCFFKAISFGRQDQAVLQGFVDQCKPDARCNDRQSDFQWRHLRFSGRISITYKYIKWLVEENYTYPQKNNLKRSIRGPKSQAYFRDNKTTTVTLWMYSCKKWWNLTKTTCISSLISLSSSLENKHVIIRQFFSTLEVMYLLCRRVNYNPIGCLMLCLLFVKWLMHCRLRAWVNNKVLSVWPFVLPWSSDILYIKYPWVNILQ